MRSVVAASAIGMTIEWYDFLIYASASSLVLNETVLSDPRPARWAKMGQTLAPCRVHKKSPKSDGIARVE